MLEPHTVLGGRYRIIEPLGEGGMGVVYRAQDERLRRAVALKTVRADDPDLYWRLRREARHLARLAHPNIVRLYDLGEHEGQPYLVTQLVDGVALTRLLGRLTPRRIAAIGGRIADALAAAHAVGIVHRDLKPSNVLINAESLHLLDFGVARHVSEDVTADRDHTIVGTASYLSPEQLRDHEATPASDVYALGLVLVESFTGRPAFSGTLAESVAARLIAPPELPGRVPPEWRALLTAMTDLEPEGRPSAPTVVTRLAPLSETRTGVAPAAGDGHQGATGWLPGTSSGVSLLGGVAGPSPVSARVSSERGGQRPAPSGPPGSGSGSGTGSSRWSTGSAGWPGSAGSLAPSGRSAGPARSPASVATRRWSRPWVSPGRPLGGRRRGGRRPLAVVAPAGGGERMAGRRSARRARVVVPAAAAVGVLLGAGLAANRFDGDQPGAGSGAVVAQAEARVERSSRPANPPVVIAPPPSTAPPTTAPPDGGVADVTEPAPAPDPEPVPPTTGSRRAAPGRPGAPRTWEGLIDQARRDWERWQDELGRQGRGHRRPPRRF